MSEQNIRQLQEALELLGFDPGPIDGVFGPGTSSAAAAFAASETGVALPVPRPTYLRVAIVVGHNARAQGANRTKSTVNDGGNIISEFKWNSPLAQDVMNYLKDAGHEARVFIRTPEGGYNAEVKRVYKQVDQWNADVSVELHFNASANKKASGTLMLSSGTKGSLRVANEIQKRTLASLGLQDRGVEVRQRSARGGESLFAGKAPSVIVEPYFGSNVNDCKAADDNYGGLIAAIAEGCLAV